MWIKGEKTIISCNHGLHQRIWNRDFWCLFGDQHAYETNVSSVIILIPWMILTTITLLHTFSCALVGVLPVEESAETKTSL